MHSPSSHPHNAPQTAALALGGPQEVPFSSGGRSWYTVFGQDFNLIEVGAAGLVSWRLKPQPLTKA